MSTSFGEPLDFLSASSNSVKKQWHSTFFEFSLIIEDHSKGVAIYNATYSIYNRNFGFIEQKMYF
jgi:hypothetical protein